MNTTATRSLDMTIRFKSKKNGYGKQPNSYAVIRDNTEVGVLVKRDDWLFYIKETNFINGVKFDYERIPQLKALTFAKLKEKVRAFYYAMGVMNA